MAKKRQKRTEENAAPKRDVQLNSRSAAPDDQHDSEGVSLKQVLEAVYAHPFQQPAVWPFDAFGLTGVALQHLDGYKRVLQPPWPPAEWETEVVGAAEAWHERLVSACVGASLDDAPPGESVRALVDRLDEDILPQPLNDAWQAFCRQCERPLNELRDAVAKPGTVDTDPKPADVRRSQQEADEIVLPILKLFAAADECAKLLLKDDGQTQGLHQYVCEWIDKSQTLSVRLESSLIRVLPKLKTPSVGFSIRSLSHHVCFWTRLEVHPTVHVFDDTWLKELVSRRTRGSSLYLLLVPSPEEISPQQFRPAESLGDEIDLARGFRFFEYCCDQNVAKLRNRLGKIIGVAETRGRVDGVILPEGAMANEHSFVTKYLARTVPFAVAGISKGRENFAYSLFNVVRGGDAELCVEAYQHKHHRWKLDRHQISNYGLGKQLDPDVEWWESNRLNDRSLKLFYIDQELMIATLICEDLARQDPVAELVRTMGPNLVITLLMDGPQVAGRWSDRYATILAEDPGSAVLTLTSIGMVRRSKPPAGCQPSCSVGLWRDPVTGVNEIELEKGSAAVLLRLELQPHLQHTADKREPISRLTPVLMERIQIAIDSSEGSPSIL